jgi:hypothetical protein
MVFRFASKATESTWWFAACPIGTCVFNKCIFPYAWDAFCTDEILTVAYDCSYRAIRLCTIADKSFVRHVIFATGVFVISQFPVTFVIFDVSFPVFISPEYSLSE